MPAATLNVEAVSATNVAQVGTKLSIRRAPAPAPESEALYL